MASRRRILSNFAAFHEELELRRDSVVKFHKNTNKDACIAVVSGVIIKAQFTLDIACYAIHNVTAGIFVLSKTTSVKVRYIACHRQKKKLKPIVEKLSISGVQVRWTTSSINVVSNLCLVDCHQDLVLAPLHLRGGPIALTAPHRCSVSKVYNDLTDGEAHQGKVALPHHEEFQRLWNACKPHAKSTAHGSAHCSTHR